MSVPSPPVAEATSGSSKVRVKPVPRWSVVRTPLRLLAVPLSIAGLSGNSAMVGVSPPLFCGPAGSSFGSNGAAALPT